MSSFDALFNSNAIKFEASFSTNNHGFSTAKEQTTEPTISNDYDELIHKPKVNGVTLIGNKTSEELNINIPIDNAQLVNGAGYTKDSDFEEFPATELLALWKSKFNS